MLDDAEVIYADTLAFLLNFIPDEAIVSNPKHVLLKYEQILKNRRKFLNSDLATQAMNRLDYLVAIGLQKHG